jgi:endonuclease/exonuclease/phosphatase (EEP) superfamily protein YafD
MRPLGKRLRQVVEGASWAYSASVVAATLLLWRIGESWWVTAVGLYVPRFVLAVPLPFLALALLRTGSRLLLGVQAVTLLFVLFPTMGLSIPAPGSPTVRADAAAPKVRVLSYNIDSTLGGVAGLTAEVDAYAPDVVAMQEIGESPAPLARAMRARYPTVLVSGQFLTATRYPVVSQADRQTVAFEGHPHHAQFVEATMTTPVGDIAFYNVHPGSPRDAINRLRGRGLRREIFSGHIFSGDAAAPILANAALRGLEVESFANAASRESVPAVIAGDTNLPGLSPIVRRYLSRFQDGFAKAGWGFGYTFPADAWPWMRIDRVFASSDLRFSAFRVGTSRASDHLCVVADLQRK